MHPHDAQWAVPRADPSAVAPQGPLSRAALQPSALPAGPPARAALEAAPARPVHALLPAQVRLRGVPQPDVVAFVARCPGCGRDAQWLQEREDTRLRTSVACDCT